MKMNKWTLQLAAVGVVSLASAIQAQEKKRFIKCPGCELELPEDDSSAQMRHMEEKHPDIIGERHRSAGIRSEFTDP